MAAYFLKMTICHLFLFGGCLFLHLFLTYTTVLAEFSELKRARDSLYQILEKIIVEVNDRDLRI